MRANQDAPNAPVIETVLSVQFDRVPGLTNAHLGAFWQNERAEFPTVKEVSPIEDRFESFGQRPVWERALKLKVGKAPSTRIQLVNEKRDRMLQLQSTRLAYNWVRRKGADYPSYAVVRPEFDNVWGRFKTFLNDQGLGPAQPNQWEVTYVNRMPVGTVWGSVGDADGVFAGEGLCVPKAEGLSLEAFRSQWQFEIPEQRGRIHVEFRHESQSDDASVAASPESLVLVLTARGGLGKSLDGIDEGLDLGHRTIVDTFWQITSPKAQEYWKGESDDTVGQ